jgi:hypothetical protein
MQRLAEIVSVCFSVLFGLEGSIAARAEVIFSGALVQLVVCTNWEIATDVRVSMPGNNLGAFLIRLLYDSSVLRMLDVDAADNSPCRLNVHISLP